MLLAQLLFNSLVYGTEVALMGLCLLLIHNVGRVFAIGIAGIGVAVGYLYYLGVQQNHLGLAIFLALFSALVLGVFHFLLLEIFSRKKLALLGLIVSLSFGAGLEALAGMIFGSDNKSIFEGVLPVLRWEGLIFPLPSLVILGLGLLIALFVEISWKTTPLGRMMRSLSESTETSEALGIHSKKIRLALHLAAALIVGLLMIMKGFRTSLTPGMGLHLVIYGFIALLVGGIRSIPALVLSAYLIITIPVFIIGLTAVQDAWFMALVFAVASLILIFFPRGITSLKTRHH